MPTDLRMSNEFSTAKTKTKTSAKSCLFVLLWCSFAPTGVLHCGGEQALSSEALRQKKLHIGANTRFCSGGLISKLANSIEIRYFAEARSRISNSRPLLERSVRSKQAIQECEVSQCKRYSTAARAVSGDLLLFQDCLKLIASVIALRFKTVLFCCRFCKSCLSYLGQLLNCCSRSFVKVHCFSKRGLKAKKLFCRRSESLSLSTASCLIYRHVDVRAIFFRTNVIKLIHKQLCNYVKITLE